MSDNKPTVWSIIGVILLCTGLLLTGGAILSTEEDRDVYITDIEITNVDYDETTGEVTVDYVASSYDNGAAEVAISSGGETIYQAVDVDGDLSESDEVSASATIEVRESPETVSVDFEPTDVADSVEVG